MAFPSLFYHLQVSGVWWDKNMSRILALPCDIFLALGVLRATGQGDIAAAASPLRCAFEPM